MVYGPAASPGRHQYRAPVHGQYRACGHTQFTHSPVPRPSRTTPPAANIITISANPPPPPPPPSLPSPPPSPTTPRPPPYSDHGAAQYHHGMYHVRGIQGRVRRGQRATAAAEPLASPQLLSTELAGGSRSEMGNMMRKCADATVRSEFPTPMDSGAGGGRLVNAAKGPRPGTGPGRPRAMPSEGAGRRGDFGGGRSPVRACVEADIARELQTTSRSGRASKCACWQPMKRSRVVNAPNNRGGQYAHIARDIKKAHTHPHMQKLVMKYIGSALSGYCPWSS